MTTTTEPTATAHGQTLTATEWANALMRGHTEEQLRRAFDCMVDLGNWKLPIDVTVGPSVKTVTRDMFLAAVDFYLGGGGTITELPDGAYRLTAPGYYATIGA